MLSGQEARLTKQRNYYQIRELINMSLALGVNLTPPSRAKKALKIINVALATICTMGMYGHWHKFTREMDDLTQAFESIFTAIALFQGVIKLIFFFFTNEKFFRLLETATSCEILQKIEIFENGFPIAEQLKTEITDIMNGIWKHINRQLIFYIFSISLICFNYFFVALGTNLYNAHKQTPNYSPKYPFPVLYPMWEEGGMSNPFYYLIFLSTSIEVYTAGLVAVAFDGLFIVLSQHIVGLIEVLKAMLRHSTSPLVPPERRVEYLCYCIDHHRRICEQLDVIQRLYRHISLYQFMISLIMLGFVMFQISVGLESDTSDTSELVRMLLYMASCCYEIIIYCYNAQRITNASEEIPLVLYNCEWYHESREFKRLLKMMIMRSNRSFYLNISWFSTMSLPTLMALFRTSGSYFLLLRKLVK